MSRRMSGAGLNYSNVKALIFGTLLEYLSVIIQVLFVIVSGVKNTNVSDGRFYQSLFILFGLILCPRNCHSRLLVHRYVHRVPFSVAYQQRLPINAYHGVLLTINNWKFIIYIFG